MSGPLRRPPPDGSVDAFATARLQARRLTPEDLPEVHRFHQDARAMSQLGGIRDLRASEAYLARNLAHWETYGFGLWLLWRNDASEIIGRACLRHLMLDDIDEVELGYGFYPAHWGQGLATEIALALVTTGFERLDCRSLVALTRPTNVASQRVMSKAGLTFERRVQHQDELHVLFRRRRM